MSALSGALLSAAHLTLLPGAAMAPPAAASAAAPAPLRILSILGVPGPEDLDGRVLLESLAP